MDLYNGLLKEISALPVIDCHEHLMSEQEYLEKPADAFTLFSHYCRHDLRSAGMDLEMANQVLFTDADIDWKWEQFAPFYTYCQDTSYFRAAHLALEKFYGEKRLTAENVHLISEKVRCEHTSGIYARILDACNIVKVMNCDGDLRDTMDGRICQSVRAKVCWDDEVGHPMLVRPAQEILTQQMELAGNIEDKQLGLARNMDDVDEILTQHIRKAAADGAYAIKFMMVNGIPADRKKAEEELQYALTHPSEKIRRLPELASYLYVKQMQLAAQYGLICTVHTGYWDDFREYAAEKLLSVLPQVPEARFDVYHMGYPHGRSAILLGKNWSNVYLNMAWTYIINPKFARDTLDEMLQMVPVNKIFAFGGDYRVPEKIWGHLTMARETIASVLADRVASHQMTTERALDVAAMMFYENPKRFYGLD